MSNAHRTGTCPSGDVTLFYRRFGATYDMGPLSDRTHPSGRKREAAAAATLAEIAAKRAAGAPLVPEPRCGVLD